MKLNDKIAKFAGAAAIALTMGAHDASAEGNTPPGYNNNPTPVTGCNGKPNCPGTPTTPPPGDVTNNYGGQGGKGGQGGQGGQGGNANADANANANATSNSSSTANSANNNNLSINNPRQVGNAPAAIAYATARCQSGLGASIGTIGFTGGLSFTKTDFKCMDYDAAQFLLDSGLQYKRGEIAILGLATFNNVSANIRMATEQVSEAYARCGKASMEANLVQGANAAMGGACPTVAPTVRRTYNMAAPRIEREKKVSSCEVVLREAAMCVGKGGQFPALTQ